MPIRRSVFLGVIVVVVLAACGSDSGGGSTSSGTQLEVEGVATTVGFVVPNPDDPASVPEPGDFTEIDISGTLTCRGDKSTGTGVFADTAIQVCLEVQSQPTVFQEVGVSDDEACTEIYGGPQHATITGSIAGEEVDVSVTRDNGCGIDDWQRLEFLLGPPER
jgi:hypothetical protein